MNGAPQIDSFEKQALSLVQAMPASKLDAELPNRSFANWFEQVIGAKAGVVWQLTECGKQFIAPNETESDLPACAEMTAVLPDRRRVFITISVGTFKKGLNGKPAFFGAVIEQNEQLYTVRRLSDLPEMLSAPDSLSDNRPATNTGNRIIDPPMIQTDPVRVLTPTQSPPSSNVPPVADELIQPPPPAAPIHPPSPQEPEKVSESDLQSRVITRVKPFYPPSAKKMKATGPVEVEITISGEGLVVEAKAISGHIALRSAAVEAARKWVFKPATFKGANIRTKGVLTFMFAPSSMD